MSVLTACQRTPDEQRIRQAIESAASAARDNDANGVLARVGDDFTGGDAELDRRGLRQLLVVRALSHDKTGVVVGPISFERKPPILDRPTSDRIVATFNLTLTGGQFGGLLPDHAASYRMTTAWRREGGDWRCYYAKWAAAAR
ncbi:MAG: hypothetical protein ACREPU_07890 [Rhodanobacteraceae bacterium]